MSFGTACEQERIDITSMVANLGHWDWILVLKVNTLAHWFVSKHICPRGPVGWLCIPNTNDEVWMVLTTSQKLKEWNFISDFIWAFIYWRVHLTESYWIMWAYLQYLKIEKRLREFQWLLFDCRKRKNYLIFGVQVLLSDTLPFAPPSMETTSLTQREICLWQFSNYIYITV